MTKRIEFERDRPLSALTSFGIGGPAKYYIEVKEISEMQHVLQVCQEEQLSFFILGRGSNTLFDDRGFAGVVIANRIAFLNRPKDDLWHVGAGYSFSLLGSQTARQGWSGLEFASGIPGSVGGAVYMNAGANKAETAHSLVSVDYVTSDGTFICYSKDELSFGYRHSSFQDKEGAIVGATFQLMKSSQARETQVKIIHSRTKTQPYNAKSAGCVFRNPASGHAGALIDQCQLKGKTIGGAQVSEVHANFIVNHNQASSADVLQLIEWIRQEVKLKTGILLQDEVRYIPYSPEKNEKL